MSKDNSVRARFDILRNIQGTTVPDAFSPTHTIGVPLTHPPRLIHVSNFTDVNMEVSLDGENAHFIVASNGFALYDIGTNKSDKSGSFEIPVDYPQAALYIRTEFIGVFATTGYVYATVIYAGD